MKIVFLDEASISLKNDMNYSALRDLGELVCFDHSSPDEILERAKDAEVIIVNKVVMPQKVIQGLPNLKHITVIATGYNNIDLDAASMAGVHVSNVRAYARHTVPQNTFAFILNLATRVPDYHQDVLKGQWQRANTFNLLNYSTFELAGKSIGIVGFGAIGQGVARIAEGFGMKILVHDPMLSTAADFPNTALEELFRESDIVSLHCPLTSENRQMINARSLSLMKPSAFLINTARGELVDENALFSALNNEQIAGAGLDVLSEEPPKENPLLGKVKNLILTPHCSWSAFEARQRLVDEVTENIRAFAGGNRRNAVTK
ncbi:MAG: D-2-hydroxyacid dehydrogenase [SAR324 cluster bacterium]|nr:D-2-hydroxyacid dehydrogenase [SAR324 cluster bacterium]